MTRDDSRPSRDNERRRNGAREDRRATARPQARRDNGGYGMDSIRRNLRVQLELRRLMRPSPWEEESQPGGNDESP